jgi:glycosyltransferase involved in cell wall biosynthesis
VGEETVRLDLVTTIIPTLDESLHIVRAVESARPLGPVFVVDCGSTDDTRELARSSGATFVEHAWEGYAAQKNWALEHLPIETEWVLMLDADEYLTDGLRAAIVAGVTQSTAVCGYLVPRWNVFMGRLLRHAWWYPDYQLRLFRSGYGRYELRSVHEHVTVTGAIEALAEPSYHENLKGVDAFLRRHERYAALEAGEILRHRRHDSGGRPGRLLGSKQERRRALKMDVWYRLPARPLLRFLWMWVLRRGFLDGREGLVYCELIAAYEAMIDANLLELRQLRAGKA